MSSAVETERELRDEMWEQLLVAGGPLGVPAQLLRRLGIYGGAQGVWVDKERTRAVDPIGVTVGLLHTGRHYADDLGDDGVIYHYPETGRPRSRDRAEVDATKAAAQLKLPVFVIAYAASGKRDVHRGWVDEAKIFKVTFQDGPPKSWLHDETFDDKEFELVSEHRRRVTETQTRPGQRRFSFLVFRRYGAACAVCGVARKEMLDAVHIRPWAQHGCDDPRNGLVLCASHHRAFDADLFCLQPETGRIFTRRQGPSSGEMRISVSSLDHLSHQPHAEALQWRWARWPYAPQAVSAP